MRDAFAGINARFHLVGCYTLIDLLLRILLAQAGDDPEWGSFLFFGFVLAWGGAFGILGLIYHAASGRSGRPSFVHYAALLFLPLLWLQIKLGALVYTPLLLGTLAWHQVAAPATKVEDWLPMAVYWIGPLADTAVLLLTLYSTPIAILLRERGARGAPIRDGVRLFFERRAESLRLLALVAPIAALGAAVHYAQGPDVKDPVPTLPEAGALLVTSYLTLVALFAACRVVALRAGPAGRDPSAPDRAASAPGPPA